MGSRTIVRERICASCGFDYPYPEGGGYRLCGYCQSRHVRPSRDSLFGAYESKRCKHCDRDYLYPFYGGYESCHDCSWSR